MVTKPATDVTPERQVPVYCPRHMVVRCTTQLKHKIMSTKKKLAGQLDLQGFKYFIAPYLSEAFKAAREKFRDRIESINKKNENKPPKEKVNAKVVGTDLVINEEIQVPFVGPLSPFELIELKDKHQNRLNALLFHVSQPLCIGGSVFTAFALRVKLLFSVQLAYVQVKILRLTARHVMAAYNIADTKNFWDDGEHFGGSQINKILKSKNLVGVAVFVTREKGS